MRDQRRRSRFGMPFRKLSGPRTGVGLTATCRAFALMLLIVVAAGGLAVYSIVRRGLSAHDEPSQIEEFVALTMRSWATPREMRTRPNPVPLDDVMLAEATEHFADHCANCHANDGSGDTAMARGMYPKPPDMRAERTQSLSDGELFWIIEHGVRLTGMPGWSTGTPDGERASWGLVHFIRRLPKLSPEDVERMERLNPKSEDEWREAEEARRFLNGEPADSSRSASRQQD